MTAERRGDALDDTQDGARRAEGLLHALEPPGSLHVHFRGSIHHDLADGLVGQVDLERTQAERFVEHVGNELFAVEQRI